MFKLARLAVVGVVLTGCQCFVPVEQNPAPDAGGGDAGPSDAGPSPGTCVARSCSEVGVDCGSIPSDCGGVIDCGPCAHGVCGSNVCYRHDSPDAGPCPPGAVCDSPKTCAQLGFNCGLSSDGLGGLLNCGSCDAGLSCGTAAPLNRCWRPADPASDAGCRARSCQDQGAVCGDVEDGCGHWLHCGECWREGVCNLEQPNQCTWVGTLSCTSVPANARCATWGAECGVLPLSDGGLVACGACDAGTTCGGGGVPLRCGSGPQIDPGCVPLSCQALGALCGIVSDRCGGQLHCGGCDAGLVCGACAPNLCGS